MGYFFWGINSLLFALILWRGWKESFLAAYPFVFAYAAWFLVTSAVKVGVMFAYGVGSTAYFHTYHVPNLAVPLWHLALLLTIYRRLDERSSARARVLWGLAFTAVVSTPIVWSIWSVAEGSAYMRFHMMVLPAQVVACGLVYIAAIRNRGTRLGNNLHFLMLGLGMMVGLQSLNFLQYFSQALAPASFSTLVPLIYMLALSTLVVGFWHYDPPGVRAGAATVVRVENSTSRSMALLLRRFFQRTS